MPSRSLLPVYQWAMTWGGTCLAPALVYGLGLMLFPAQSVTRGTRASMTIGPLDLTVQRLDGLAGQPSQPLCQSFDKPLSWVCYGAGSISSTGWALCASAVMELIADGEADKTK